MEFWNTVTEAQATIIAAILTIVAAVAGVTLGGWIFGGRVTNLSDALKASEDVIAKHEKSVEEKLRSLLASVETISMDISVTLARVNTLSIQSADLESPASAAPEVATNPREIIQTNWKAIRDTIEELVNDPSIDGRTRAKYARIDRRQYGQLIEAVYQDGNLKHIGKYRRALEIWQKFRTGRAKPTKAEVDEITSLREVISPSS